MLNEKVVLKALQKIGNTFFTVTFVTNNGEERTYNGRMNVKGIDVPNEISAIVKKAFQENGLVPIKTSQGFKTFRVTKVKQISGAGEVWFDKD